MSVLKIILAAIKRDSSYLIGAILTFAALFFLFVQHDWQSRLTNNLNENSTPDLPDFSLVSNSQQRNKLLFDYLRPKIEKENNKIKYKQALLVSILNNMESESYHVSSNSKKLHKLAKEFGLEAVGIKDNIDELKSRIDIVPTSLILAQAANENDWRVSRFSSQTAIADYLSDLNSLETYIDFRNIRAGLRRRGQRVTAIKLAHGLMPYSENGQQYINKIIKTIKHNSLE